MELDPIEDVAQAIIEFGRGNNKRTAAIMAAVYSVAHNVAEHGDEINRNSDVTYLAFAISAAAMAANVYETWHLAPEDVRKADLGAEEISELLHAAFVTTAPGGAEGEEE